MKLQRCGALPTLCWLAFAAVGVDGGFLVRRHSDHVPEETPSDRDIQALFSMAGSSEQHQPFTYSTPAQKEAWKAYRPCGSCKQPVRIGERNDGGYIMCGELLAGTTAAYSYGISGYDGWGAQISNQLGVRVEQYDCYNLNQPACPVGLKCNFTFHGECISSYPHHTNFKSFKTLRDHMAANGHAPLTASGGAAGANIVMKMDVEGAEWEVFADTSVLPLLERFSQVVVEFHLTEVVTPAKQRALQNLLQLFTVVHVHANNCCQSTATVEGYSVPSVLEVSFVRRGLVPEGVCRSGPQQILSDHRNVPGKPHPAPIKLP